MLSVVDCDPFGNLQVELVSYTIQDTSNYVFTLDFNGDATASYTIPVGSDLVITFPSQYPLLPATVHTCAIISWPTAYSTITCSLTYQTLTIQNAFTSAVVIGMFSSLTMKWIVNDIKNPNYAQTTSQFRGVIKFNSTAVFNSFGPSTGLGITITPGSLTATMSVDPSGAD